MKVLALTLLPATRIQLYTVAKLIEYCQRDDNGFNASFALRCIKQRYGEANPTYRQCFC